jgi:multicomponent Na+:H+ antiporter subunit A
VLLAASAVSPFLADLPKRFRSLALAAPAIGVFGYFLGQVPGVANKATAPQVLPWATQLGLDVSFFLDGLAANFALLVTGIGFLVVLYAAGYMEGDKELGRMCAFLYLFMTAMLGLVIADNVFLLFIFWELTSVSSYLLIGFKHEKEASRKAALRALIVTGAGGLALMGGLILLGMAAGSFQVSEILARGEQVKESGLYVGALLLILAGCFTKSAQFPFHFWLPGAMAAPTPVSAYLHSATMVKAGVFLLARLHPAIGGTALFQNLVIGFGAATVIVGAVVALTKTDLKQLLAYSTINALGTLVMLIGVGTANALHAMLAFLWAHALYKGALFMVAGAVDHASGTREVDEVDGLARAMPLTGFAAGLAGLSFMGIIASAGFTSKELMLKAFEAGPSPIFSIVALLIGAISGGAVALVIMLRVFFFKKLRAPAKVEEVSWTMVAGPVVLSVLGVVLALFASGTWETALIGPGLDSMTAAEAAKPVKWFYEADLFLVLSATSWGLGLGTYLIWDRIRALSARVEPLVAWGPLRLYDFVFAGILSFASGLTRIVQSGYLRAYVGTIVVTAVVMMLATGAISHAWPLVIEGMGTLFGDIYAFEALAAAVVVAGAFSAVLSKSRLSAIVSLGAVGLGIALLYVNFGAPDLAITQFIVEILTVILFVLVFYHLPGFRTKTREKLIWLEGIIAGAFGLVVTMLVLSVSTFNPSRISEWHAENVYTEAYGRNIVNVILVDFRALDTMGEILVLGVAALGVVALLRLRPRKEETASNP